MLARLHHYEELADHVAYVKRMYGQHWEAELKRRGVVWGHALCDNVLKHRKSFPRVLLPRLRALRRQVEALCPTSLAKPSLTSGSVARVLVPLVHSSSDDDAQ